MVFVSGTPPFDLKTGQLVRGDIETQAEGSLRAVPGDVRAHQHVERPQDGLGATILGSEGVEIRVAILELTDRLPVDDRRTI
jgi:hypothetical protein